jgi:hypothetical protein
MSSFHIERMGEKRNSWIFVGKPGRKKPLGRLGRRWEDNIRNDLREIGWGGMAGLIWLRIGTSGVPL